MSQTRQLSPSLTSSYTQVETASESLQSNLAIPVTPTLRLRGEQLPQEQRVPKRRIRWGEDVIDNEGMGKKSSKVCCIYHKTRAIGESSSEPESSDSSSDSDAKSDSDREAKIGRAKGAKRRDHHHIHDHTEDPGDDRNRHESDSDAARPRSRGPYKAKAIAKQRKPSPNAYEKAPKSNRRLLELRGS